MKKIGFVDYYISEWHANNYPAWIERIAADMGAALYAPDPMTAVRFADGCGV